MRYLHFLPFCLLLCFVNTATAQGVKISTNPGNPHSSAMLEVGDSTKGFLMPRLTTTQRNAISNPAIGLQIVNITTQCVEVYFSSGWKQVVCDCTQPPGQPGNITGPAGFCSSQQGVSYSINPVPGASSYTWTVPPGATVATGQGTASITVNFGNAGGNVTVAAQNTCGASSQVQLAVSLSSPNAAFTPTSGSISTPVNFTPQPGYASYSWTFPSGSPATSNLQNPQATWVSQGTYAVSLTVTDIYGCTASATQQTQIVNCPPGSQAFNYTGGQQTFVVPGCVSSVHVVAIGAQGGDVSGMPGGGGGKVEADMTVTPGSTLYINVGQKPTTLTGGWNGGGNGISGGMGGGGATDIRSGGTGLNNRILVAGAGGGSVSNGGLSSGGAGGGLTGGTAQNGNVWGCTNLLPATGGTQSTGGLGGTSTSCAWNGQNGSFGIGGNSHNNYTCSGGGGGWYGGGGAHNGGGGGGGSSYTAPGVCTNVVHSQGFNVTTNGSVVISW